MPKRKKQGLVLRDGTPVSDLVKVDEGLVAARIFTDPEIYQLEMEKIFAKAWIVVAHDSEIPNPGDFVTRYMGEDSVIVVRDERGQVHILLNTCSHRGVRVCRTDLGSASSFRCSYHGAAYNNTGECVGFPFSTEAYGESLDRSKFDLKTARVGTYGGVIFGTWNQQAPSLDDYLGDIKWYLDLMLNRTDGGVEVIGPPQRWIIKSNWKLGAENFIGDAYHVITTHACAVQMGLAPPDPKFTFWGIHVNTNNGHGLGIGMSPPGVELPPYLSLPREMLPEIERNLTRKQQEALQKISNFIHGTVFPNFSFLNPVLTTEPSQPLSSFLTLRTWNPKGPDETEINSWIVAEKTAPEWHKEASRKLYISTFGSSGIFEQDDTENWGAINRSIKGVMGRRQQFNLQMSLDRQPNGAGWPGPGTVYQGDFAEANQLAFYGRWLEFAAQE